MVLGLALLTYFIAKITDNADDLSHKFDNNARRSLDANESSESLEDKDVVPFLEEQHCICRCPKGGRAVPVVSIEVCPS